MVLAAGRGERMRPLTDRTPKPLLSVGGRRLIEWHLLALARAGIREVIVNHAWLGAQIPAALGDGSRYGLALSYSDEGDAALETGGGIFKALPWLGDGPFLVVNGDVWCDLDLARLPTLAPGDTGLLVMVDNPPQHPRGDFVLDGGRIRDHAEGGPRLTFSGIALYRAAFFEGCVAGRFPMLPLFRRAAAAEQLAGVRHEGLWFDVGTPERLRELDERLAAGALG